MILHTASEGITFARKLENDAADFYEDLARRNTPSSESFLSFARENRKNVTQVERAYYGVITDAIEGCFAFNIDPEQYVLKTSVEEGESFAGILARAAEVEKTIIRFYQDAAEQSKSLMADVPRAFMMIARKRESRLAQLEALLKG